MRHIIPAKPTETPAEWELNELNFTPLVSIVFGKKTRSKQTHANKRTTETQFSSTEALPVIQSLIDPLSSVHVQ